jgi:transketolase
MPEGLSWSVYDLSKELTQAEVYGKVLVELARENKNIVALTADLARSTKIGVFFDAYPERAFNFGVAEQNMMGAAAGFAISGKIPYVSTFGIFASTRAAEQVRTDIAYPKLKVRIIGTHAGVSFGQAGTTHHATEDIAIMRSMANMTVIVPADSVETANAVIESVDYPGPLYIRVGRGLEPLVYDREDYGFKIGKAVKMREGKDISVIACGVCVLPSVEASDELKEEGIKVKVINMHTIKPIDREAILEAAETSSKIIITVEEHNIIGGLGGAVAEVLAEEGCPARLVRIGIPDIYSAIGYPHDLYMKYGFDIDGIKNKIKEVLGK